MSNDNDSLMFNKIIKFIKKTYQTKNFIPLHEPKFIGNEKIS